MNEAATLLGQLREERQALRDTVHSLAVDAVRQAARRLLMDVPAEWPTASSVALALADWRALDLADQVTLRVHPEDLSVGGRFGSLGQSRRSTWATEGEAPGDATRTDEAIAKGWSLRPDPTLKRGQCVLRHTAGSIHADFSVNVLTLCDALVSLDWLDNTTHAADTELNTNVDVDVDVDAARSPAEVRADRQPAADTARSMLAMPPTHPSAPESGNGAVGPGMLSTPQTGSNSPINS
ncbi:hypothetical protein [Roseateles amylovorans]|uniref:Uncharacterized protein n=1 Tax=Roseateles amylovorans TaxID=2978473 RepID=A0ABY6B7I9_9BURK|nr:hypothetical protein [Roseateles amylovorans]UXH79520.1 hypothetical protein N4261_06245 [Roseateles amylovorans]